MVKVFITIALGIFTGISSGMFGIGGALMGTPLLRVFLGFGAKVALGTPIPVAIPSGVSGTVAYYKSKLIDFKLVIYMMIIAFPMNILGSYMTEYVSGKILMILTGIILFLVGGTFFIRGWLLREEKEYEKRTSIISYILTGVIVGFLSGFLAIGGGIIMVPVFVRFNRMNLKEALATSLFCVVLLAIPSSIIHFSLGHIDVITALILAVTVIPFSYIGAKIAIALKNRTLERIYAIFVLLFAVYFTYTEIFGA